MSIFWSSVRLAPYLRTMDANFISTSALADGDSLSMAACAFCWREVAGFSAFDCCSAVAPDWEIPASTSVGWIIAVVAAAAAARVKRRRSGENLDIG